METNQTNPSAEPKPKEQSVYRESLPYACEHDELPKYHADVHLNEECRDAIGAAIDKSQYKTNFYNMKDAVKEVTDTYGAERTELVMAKIVQDANYDGRYSSQNKEWAEGFEIPQSMNNIYSNTHPVLLNGFLDKVREKPSMLETLKSKSEKSKSPAEPKQKKAKQADMER